MESKRKITQYREKLDKALASPELTEVEKLKTLLKNQLLRSSSNDIEECSENVLQRKTTEVSSFLDTMRSASINDNEMSKTKEATHGEWKLKQDTEEFRVMYREGPQGTPFHTLLVEGYVDAPVDACLCISWESELYRKWWPQFSFPTFKILSSKCLKKVRIAEELSLVRVKVPWPLSTREAVVHYFLLEYFQGDLIVILLNTIADLEGIDKSTHGFTNKGIPEAKDVVRIDLVGGFVIQKVTSERSYFRVLTNVDIKLDFVPPSLINFITRQLVGSGFKLYQKASTSVSASHEDYGTVLGEPMYAQIREALYSKNESNEDLRAKKIKDDLCIPLKQHIVQTMQDDLGPLEEKFQDVHLVARSSSKHGELMHSDAFGGAEEIRFSENIARDNENGSHIGCDAQECSLKNSQYTDGKAFGEIEEEGNENRRDLDKEVEEVDQPPRNAIAGKKYVNGEKNITISHEVEQALGTLEKAISIVRGRRLNGQSRSLDNFTTVEVPYLGKGSVADHGVCSNSEDCIEVAKNETLKRTSHESKSSSGIHEVRSPFSNSFSREMNHNKIVPASPEQELSVPGEFSEKALHPTRDGPRVISISDQTILNNKQRTTAANGTHENGLAGEKLSQLRKRMFCCIRPGFGSRMQAEGRG